MSKSLSRIKQYIDYKGINISSFEKSIGISNGAFSSQLRKNKSIGVDKLENILTVYPDLNGDWVLTGEGDMLRKSQEYKEPPSITLPIILEKNYELTIESLKSVISAQKKTIAALEQLLAKKN